MKTGKTAGKVRRSDDAALREHVVNLLKGGTAHVRFRDAVEGFPVRKRGAFAHGLAHTGWQLLEHARLAQKDILEFSRSSEHISPEFPEGYWPKSPLPPNDAAWRKSLQAFETDLLAMVRLVRDRKLDLFAKLPHGTGQTLLREALTLADHNAYHLGQLVDLRRALGVWPE